MSDPKTCPDCGLPTSTNGPLVVCDSCGWYAAADNPCRDGLHPNAPADLGPGRGLPRCPDCGHTAWNRVRI